MRFSKRWRNLIIIPSIFFHANMSKLVPEKVFLREVFLHYLIMKKTAAESHRILVELYGKHALAARTCQKWFARF